MELCELGFKSQEKAHQFLQGVNREATYPIANMNMKSAGLVDYGTVITTHNVAYFPKIVNSIFAVIHWWADELNSILGSTIFRHLSQRLLCVFHTNSGVSMYQPRIF